jgi:hypothetical protein
VRWGAHLARLAVTPKRAARSAEQAIDSAIHTSGFTQTRHYFASPSEASQRILIPAERSAIVAQERLERALSKTGRLRGVLASAGMYDALYPVRIVLCRR